MSASSDDEAAGGRELQDSTDCRTPDITTVPQTWTWLVPLLIAVVGGAIILAIYTRLRMVRRLRKFEKLSFDRNLETIRRSLDQETGMMQYPYVVIRAQDFLLQGALESYEECRRAGKHVVMDDTYQLKQFERKQRIIFFSHQWTSFHEPDHSKTQYKAMVAALQRVQTANKWPLEHTFVWVDYSCVPQMHRPTQELAIASIAIYSSRAHAFVAVVPPVRHQETSELCTDETYQKRLWTRAESLTHLLLNGSSTMWVASATDAQSCVPMPAEWLRGSVLNIFEGVSTCCQRNHVGMERCDRELLVQPLLSMYGKLYAENKTTREKLVRQGASSSARQAEKECSVNSHSSCGLHSARSLAEPSPSVMSRSRRNSHVSQSLQQLDATSLFELQLQRTTCTPCAEAGDSMVPAGEDAASGQGSERRTSFNSCGSSAFSYRSLASSHMQKMQTFEMISQLEQILFPATFKFSVSSGESVETELFGDLIGLMRTIIDNDRRLRRHLSGEQKRMQIRRNLFDSSEDVPRRYRRLASISSSTSICRDTTNSELTATASAAESSLEQKRFSLSEKNIRALEALEKDRRRSSATHDRLFAKCGRKLSLDSIVHDQLASTTTPAALPAAATKPDPPVDAARLAKLRRRWSIQAERPLARSEDPATDQDPGKRLALSSSILRARRDAEWLDGEKEFATDSHRGGQNLGYRQSMHARQLVQKKNRQLARQGSSNSLLRFMPECNCRDSFMRRCSRGVVPEPNKKVRRRSSRESNASHCSWADEHTEASLSARRSSDVWANEKDPRRVSDGTAILRQQVLADTFSKRWWDQTQKSRRASTATRTSLTATRGSCTESTRSSFIQPGSFVRIASKLRSSGKATADAETGAAASSDSSPGQRMWTRTLRSPSPQNGRARASGMEEQWLNVV